MKHQLRLFILLLTVLVGIALAHCPEHVACPYDGEAMSNTQHCRSAPHACEYLHLVVIDGKLVRHTTWVTCGD